MADPVHLNEGDYPKAFPPDLDAFPTPVNDEHFIDAWLFNTLFNSLLSTEQYLIEYKDNIEAPLGGDVLGEDGQLEISIPPARYPAYRTAMAWDSNLLEENIKNGETIFGVIGSLAVAAGGVSVIAPGFSVIPFLFPSTINMNAGLITVPVPGTSVV